MGRLLGDERTEYRQSDGEDEGQVFHLAIVRRSLLRIQGFPSRTLFFGRRERLFVKDVQQVGADESARLADDKNDTLPIFCIDKSD